MNTTIKKVTLSEKDTLANLLEKYNYEFSQYDKRQFNDNGLFGYKYLNNYFTEESRYAYFIYADEKLAGFALINKYKECERPIDWSMAEFFVSYNFPFSFIVSSFISAYSSSTFNKATCVLYVVINSFSASL